MERKEVIAKMKLLKDYREKKISGENGKVLDVKYLGNLSKNDADKEALIAIYVAIEQYKKDGKLVEIEQYYSEDLQTGNFKYIAGDNKNDGIEKIFLSDRFIDSKEREYLENALNLISKEGEIYLANEEKIEKMAKKIGITPEEIESIAELEANQEIESEQKEENKEKGEDKELNEKQTKTLTKVAGKQEVNINAKFDGKTPLRNELGLGGEYKSIVVVYSEKLKEIQGKDNKKNNSPVAFLAIRNDGNAEIIDSLELDTSTGARPTKEAIKVDADGTARQDRETLARYKTPKGYLSIQRGQYGEMKVYHGQKTREENRPVEFQLETNSLRPTKKEMKDLQRPGQGQYHIDNIEDEFSEHVNHGEKELKNREDYDGNKETATHIHEENSDNEFIDTDVIIEQWAEEIMKNDAIEEAFTNKEVKEMVEKYLEKDGEITLENIEKNIEKDADMYLDHQKSH
ncbi:MAG: hypothetical protein IKF38_07330 [Clostridia bacterium]|nr:hypothetical protein [Clostridia bacterium]